MNQAVAASRPIAYGRTPQGASTSPAVITTTRSAREPMPTSPLRASPSAFARVYETRNDPATAANVRPTATISWWRANTSAIAPSMKPSLTRSVVESRKAPNGVVFPPARASAPSRMSRIDPITNTTAPSQ